MRADNTRALGRAPAWELGLCSSLVTEVSLQAWRRNGWKKPHREVLAVPTAVLWLNPHTPGARRKCSQVLGSTSLVAGLPHPRGEGQEMEKAGCISRAGLEISPESQLRGATGSWASPECGGAVQEGSRGFWSALGTR